MEVNDPPEIDETPFLDFIGIKKYQILMGSVNWAVILGRFNINYGVCTMARFTFKPRKGHMKRVVRIFEYIKTKKK